MHMALIVSQIKTKTAKQAKKISINSHSACLFTRRLKKELHSLDFNFKVLNSGSLWQFRPHARVSITAPGAAKSVEHVLS